MSVDLPLCSDLREMGSALRAAGIVVEIQAAVPVMDEAIDQRAMIIVLSAQAAASFVTLAHEEVQGFLSRRASF